MRIESRFILPKTTQNVSFDEISSKTFLWIIDCSVHIKCFWYFTTLVSIHYIQYYSLNSIVFSCTEFYKVRISDVICAFNGKSFSSQISNKIWFWSWICIKDLSQTIKSLFPESQKNLRQKYSNEKNFHEKVSIERKSSNKKFPGQTPVCHHYILHTKLI